MIDALQVHLKCSIKSYDNIIEESEEVHLLVFQVGGHSKYDVFTGFLHAEKPAGFQQATLVKIKSSMLTCGFYKQ